jgi:hypothetical protein
VRSINPFELGGTGFLNRVGEGTKLCFEVLRALEDCVEND